MIRAYIAGGPYMHLLALLALVVLVLSIRRTIDLFARRERDPERLALGVDAILFWGCIAAVLGFLGQFTGMYLSLRVIRRAGLIDPALVAEGIAVSLVTTVFGLIILIVSALLWFALRCRLSQVAARSGTRGAISPRS
jgi:hypothetical protein